eukprot:CAMPEP_0206406940 /NCGR_PEP_ID=MMETSP0294-20121207/30145_1 /ASSEMBLY_ACC=CAM_ASM_000327 /TAXON_ID=39354 /ORGANISM="Heterosigma akashiwo, Strain CCMP2393" /LENGTH=154 /DNA_ID=CAMNT_0053865889 /DNA_START=373 /DNA_END=833 /DNA_ORIENTATION=+
MKNPQKNQHPNPILKAWTLEVREIKAATTTGPMPLPKSSESETTENIVPMLSAGLTFIAAARKAGPAGRPKPPQNASGARGSPLRRPPVPSKMKKNGKVPKAVITPQKVISSPFQKWVRRFGKKKVGNGKGGRVSWSQRARLRRSDRLMKKRRV